MIHRDIKIPFTIGDHYFEAVGFLHNDEVVVDTTTMLARANRANGGVIGYFGVGVIDVALESLPESFRPYILVTNHRFIMITAPFGDLLLCFIWFGDTWRRHWIYMASSWDQYCLVLCRRE